jgi:hypothetical protein
MGRKSREDALRIYDLLREAHKSIRQAWREYPDLRQNAPMWETAIDAVDNTLYLAEDFFVKRSQP